MTDEEQRLRDMFAAAALTGILAQSFTSDMTPAAFADEAYLIADSMMDERKKEWKR